MRESWLKLVACVLRPARPRLERCLRERAPHLEGRRVAAEERARAIASCSARIEQARAEVFAAGDGVVTTRMTDLEREWRILSRPDPDGGLMDLWARIAPSSWLDRKRWRDDAPAARLDAAIALASDVEGVEAAEAAVGALRDRLLAWGTSIGSRVRWRSFARDFDGTADLLAEPLRVAQQALPSRGASVVLDRARLLAREVHAAAVGRLPGRALLARAVAHAAFVDAVWCAARLPARENPVTPLCALWSAGYALLAVDARDVTVEIPAL